MESIRTLVPSFAGTHVLLTNLVPAGTGCHLSAEQAAELLRGIQARATAGKSLRGLAVDLVAEIGQLNRRIIKATRDIQTAVADSGTTRTELCGIGALTAGTILGRVGTIERFRFATASPPTPAPHRSTSPPLTQCATDSPAPAIVKSTAACMSSPSPQIWQDTTGRAHYLRKRTEGKGHEEAMRCLKRRLSDIIYRQLLERRGQKWGRPGRTFGGGSTVQRGQLKPRMLTLRTSHFPEPPATTLQPTGRR